MRCPPLMANDFSSMNRVCHQCVRVSHGDVDRIEVRSEPSKWTSNQPATPCTTQVSRTEKAKDTAKRSSCSARSVRRSKSSKCGSAFSRSGWTWSCRGLLKVSSLALASSEDKSTPRKSFVAQGCLASTARERCSASSEKGARQSVARLGNMRPPGFMNLSLAMTTVSMPRSAKRKLPRVSLTMTSTCSGTSSRISCRTRFTTTILSAQPFASARLRMTSAMQEASTQ
mmetsp:Transcript_56778/g.178289  ORF Transcript_56778/g.178289 Transcript_56778/m.178289 type:complete len:228 (+) Transcript_56778:491-1174(+)